MKIKSTSSHRVEIHQSDIVNWFDKNSKDIDKSGMRVLSPLPQDGDTAVLVAIPVSKTYLDTILQAEIKKLPPQGQYNIEILPHAKDIIGVITWNGQ